ncbi:MAG: amidohydrolase [Planctomycetota bacterium]|nr:amidohydrolase [Planctomycetota bacterium]
MSTFTPELQQRIRSRIESILPDLVTLRRDLHAHPELGYEEHRTSKVVQTQLTEAGVEFVSGLGGGTGILGHLPGGSDRAVGLRADMDALPITERTGCEWSSTHDGVMHACGHDGHTTMLVGAARVLASLSTEDPLPQPVSFVFQPAEEGGGGGLRMCEDGCLEGRVLGPAFKSMYGLHGWPAWPLGVVGSRPGAMLAASDRFEITVEGLGGHAAMPHTTQDPVYAASLIVTALQQVVARNVNPVEGGVISVTSIQGGSAFNVIPNTVRMGGTLRALEVDALATARRRLAEVVEATARAAGCVATLDYTEGYPVTRNHPEAFECFESIARRTVGEDRVQPMEFPVMGGEDFSYYGQRVPACFFVLGLLPPGTEAMPGLHHPEFDFNDEALATGVELLCRLALEA